MRVTKVVKALLVTMILALLPAAPASAGAGQCTRVGPTLNVLVEGSNVQVLLYTLLVENDQFDMEIQASDGTTPTPPDCGDATTDNVDKVIVSGTSARELLQITVTDGTGASFAPGDTDELLGVSEIEVEATLGAGVDALLVAGASSADDTMTAGKDGINWNDDDDPDVTWDRSIEIPGMEGSSGEDTLTATGGTGTGKPVNVPMFLAGSSGDDRITGGLAGDWLNGGSDDDFLNGGPGNDRLGETHHFLALTPIEEAGNDKLKGGPGGDVIRTGAGNDRSKGGAGDDEEHGELGDDLFLQERKPNGADLMYGGDGIDVVLYNARKTDLKVTLDDEANDGARGEGDLVGYDKDIEDVEGGDGADRLLGNALGNVLSGQNGPDKLRGKGGIDLLLGGDGRDDCDAGGDPGDEELNC